MGTTFVSSTSHLQGRRLIEIKVISVIVYVLNNLFMFLSSSVTTLRMGTMDYS